MYKIKLTIFHLPKFSICFLIIDQDFRVKNFDQKINFKYFSHEKEIDGTSLFLVLLMKRIDNQ